VVAQVIAIAGARSRVITPMKALLRCAAGLAIASASTSAPARAAERPMNVVVLLADDQRWDTLGVYGNPIVQTPELDRLAREGVRFERAFVTTSICATSRASFITGQYARRHGIWTFEKSLSPEQLAKSYLGRMKAAGYHLGFIGKWGVGKPPKDYFDYDRTFAGQGAYAVEVDGQTRHLTSVMGDQAVEFVRTAPAGRPFCLSVSFKAPHVQDSYDITDAPFPYDPRLSDLYRDVEIDPPASAAPGFFERLPRVLQDSEARLRWAIRFWGPARYQESVKGYYRLITGIDRVVGRLRAALEERGLRRDTAIVYTGDNGFFLGEHGLAGKWTPHEPSIHVPLLAYDPRLPDEARGRTLREMALNVDVAPTLLALAGLEPSDRMQGRSLLPLIRGEATSWRTEFFYEHLFEHPRLPKMEGVRTEDRKYIRYVETDPVVEELYDLQRDPQEVENLAGRKGSEPTLARLRQSWSEWREAVR
jgi:arylsulfatase A-like enzyme